MVFHRKLQVATAGVDACEARGHPRDAGCCSDAHSNGARKRLLGPRRLNKTKHVKHSRTVHKRHAEAVEIMRTRETSTGLGLAVTP